MLSMVRRMVAPPLYSERLTPAQWKMIALVRATMIAVAISIDIVLYLAMRGSPDIDRDTLRFFAVTNITVLSILLAVAAPAVRFQRFRRRWIVGISSVFEVLTTVIWVQATGTVTSYFIIVGVLILAAYRFFLGYWVAFTVTVALLLLHGGAAAVEMAGGLRPEALFLGAPSRVYAVSLYHGFAIASIACIYAITFLALNVISNKLHEKEHALAQVRREVARVAEEVKHGRLTGTLLAEEYALGEVLGRGGMGEIYVARRVSDEEPVAVKVLHGHLVSDDTYLERFRREAAAAERVPHRYTARVLDVGSAPAQGLHYIVMEYLRGEDLAAFLRRRGPLPPDDLLPLAHKIAEALDAAHDVNVVHRDLKPQNVFLVEDSTQTGASADTLEVRLLDFGMSKILDSGETTLTQADVVIGTIAYMSPEQALGRIDDIGPAADRFAFAAILYRALTGKAAFQSGDLLGAIREIVHVDPAPPSYIRPELHRDVDSVIAIGMAKRIEDRYATARALVEDLERAAAGNLEESTRARAQSIVSSTAEAATIVAER